MPEFKVTHYDVYKCHSFVTAENIDLARQKFDLDDGVDGPDPIEWNSRCVEDEWPAIEELT